MSSVTVKFRETNPLNLFMHLETICTVRTKGDNLGYLLVSADQYLKKENLKIAMKVFVQLLEVCKNSKEARKLFLD